MQARRRAAVMGIPELSPREQMQILEKLTKHLEKIRGVCVQGQQSEICQKAGAPQMSTPRNTSPFLKKN
eukprot:334121-Lingulodinium_polyedra.AAC.1